MSDQLLEATVQSYADLVYAAALRQMRGDASGAQDVTQAVMLILIRKQQAGALPEERFMAGWILKITHYTVLQAKRAAARRSRHEANAAQPSAEKSAEGELERDVREALDNAVLSLGAVDREAVVRRYLHGQSLIEVGAAMGINENTAGRRVARALEKLRKILTRKGIAAPAGLVAAVMGAEAATKAPSACMANVGSHAASALADRVIWKMLLNKVLLIILTGFGVAAVVGGVWAGAFVLDQPAPSPAPPPVAAAPSEPTSLNVNVTRVVDGPSDALLKEVLAGLRDNQGKLRTIHVEGTAYSQMRDSTGRWIEPVRGTGRAWMESASPRRERIEMSREAIRAVQEGGFGPLKSSSYTNVWNGTEIRILYSDRTGATYDNNYSKGEELLGMDFSMQLCWDKETASGTNGGNTITTIDRYPLDPAVLAQMKLSARKVILDSAQEAMELTVEIPDPAIARKEIFWFDPGRGYGLLARQDTLTVNGIEVRRIVRIISTMAEAAPGIFYPTHAVSTWVQGGVVNQVAQAGELVIRGEFDATKVVANEPIGQDQFQLNFAKGMTVWDFKGGIGTKRIIEGR